MPHDFPPLGRRVLCASDDAKVPPPPLTTPTTTVEPNILGMTTAAPKSEARKPSQLGLFCTTSNTDKENGRLAGRSKTTTLAAASSSSRQDQSSSSSSSSTTIPKHIYDSEAKAFYTVGKFLGKGGFASCYEISSDVSGKHYAAKIVPKASLQKSKQKTKLLQEIKIHKSLRHDNIVRLYRVFEDDAHVYIIMELCEQQTMMELMKKKGRLTDEEAKPILLQLLAAMEYLHNNHVIHRDLKLGNLFLKAGPTVKLGDFGLATLVYNENDRKRTICGTPNYIAPEIIAGGERGHSYEVDIWSFGVIMYTMLVGQPPFQRQEVKEIYEKIKVANFDFPAHLTISLPAKDLINCLLHPDPEKRPSIADIRSHAYFTGQALDTSSVASCSAPSSSTATGSSSGLILSIQRAISTILSNYTGMKNHLERISTPGITHLSQCHDFSHKYGIAYVVSNGAHGCYFNDGTSVIISPDKRRAHYFQPDDRAGVLVRESFYFHSGQEPKEQLRTRLKIMQRFEGILASAPVMPTGPSSSGDEELVFLVKFFKSAQATFYRLSHRVLQVNFYDNSRLIFGEEGRVITFVDQERRCLAFTGETSRTHLSSLITGKLQYINEVISSIITNQQQ